MELIIKRQIRITGRVEVVRSCSRRLNIGNYESVDFFCSQKAECAAEDAAEVGRLAHQFCKKQVLDSLAEYQDQATSQFAPRRAS